VLRREYPILLAISAGVYLLMVDRQLSFGDGLIMLFALAATLFLLVRIGLARTASDPMIEEYEAEIRSDLSTFAASMWFIAGLVLLLISSRMLVWGAVEIATALGVSDLVIGLTIVAIGTSLPELAASIMSALKDEPDIAVGNVIGSNIYNLLAVLCVPGLVAAPAISDEVLTRDLPVMLGLTLVLFLMGRGRNGDGHINRFEGAVLLASFLAYQGWLYFEATRPVTA
jgi:cation:H+ antiporter